MRRSLLLCAAVVATSVAFAAPAQAVTPANTVVDVAVGASGGGTPDGNPADYDILVSALGAAGLVDALKGEGPFTVFAPNDRAFQRLATTLTGQSLGEQATLEAIAGVLSGDGDLANVLKYHVVAGRRLGPLQVLLSRRITMFNGEIVRPLLTILRDEQPGFADPRLVLNAIDIDASNGVIHTIDRVLLPDPLLVSGTS